MAEFLGPLATYQRPLFVHAHPDDETISTGALIAALSAAGQLPYVLTATRGEQGETREGAVPEGVDLVLHRENERDGACRTLGVASTAWLGRMPARGKGLDERVYTDSGMTWLDDAQTQAGPGPDAGPDSLTAAGPREIATDILAFARAVDADALITYDAAGGYGHPDHVALVAPTLEAGVTREIPVFEIVSQPRSAGSEDGRLEGSAADAGDDGTCWLDLRDELPTVAAALGHYASQLSVDGDHLVHVGGQREPIQLRIGLRRLR